MVHGSDLCMECHAWKRPGHFSVNMEKGSTASWEEQLRQSLDGESTIWRQTPRSYRAGRAGHHDDSSLDAVPVPFPGQLLRVSFPANLNRSLLVLYLPKKIRILEKFPKSSQPFCSLSWRPWRIPKYAPSAARSPMESR